MPSAKKAISYGATGAALGAPFGGFGAAIGGGLGALAGGLFGSDDSDNAAQDALAQAGTQITDLQKTQRAQRQQDLSRALGYFNPYNQLMNKMYGTPMPNRYVDPNGFVPTARSGAGHFGGMGAAPPPPALGVGPAPGPVSLGNKYADNQMKQAPPPVDNKYAAQQRKAMGYF